MGALRSCSDPKLLPLRSMEARLKVSSSKSNEVPSFPSYVKEVRCFLSEMALRKCAKASGESPMSNSYGSGLAVDPAFNSGTFEVKDLYFKTTLPSQRGMHRVQPLAINDKTSNAVQSDLNTES